MHSNQTSDFLDDDKIKLNHSEVFMLNKLMKIENELGRISLKHDEMESKILDKIELSIIKALQPVGERLKAVETKVDDLHTIASDAQRISTKLITAIGFDESNNTASKIENLATKEDIKDISSIKKTTDKIVTAIGFDENKNTASKIEAFATKKTIWLVGALIVFITLGGIIWLSKQNPQTGAAIGNAAGQEITKEVKSHID